MLRNVTITLPEEIAQWARRKAADENTSVSKLIGRILEEQMRRGNEYWQAYERWKKLDSIPGIDAARRLSGEEAHARLGRAKQIRARAIVLPLPPRTGTTTFGKTVETVLAERPARVIIEAGPSNGDGLGRTLSGRARPA